MSQRDRQLDGVSLHLLHRGLVVDVDARMLVGADAVGGEIKLFADGHVDDAQDGDALVNQGDVDGKLAIAFDELLRPVQRVDQPKGLPFRAFLEGDLLPFLAQDREGRDREGPRDETVGRLVGLRQRRVVGLELDAKVHGGVLVNVHD